MLSKSPAVYFWCQQPGGGHCHFPTRIQSSAALSHMKTPALNRHTCPSKPNLNDRLV